MQDVDYERLGRVQETEEIRIQNRASWVWCISSDKNTNVEG